jgi:hypothetical protein
MSKIRLFVVLWIGFLFGWIAARVQPSKNDPVYPKRNRTEQTHYVEREPKPTKPPTVIADDVGSMTWYYRRVQTEPGLWLRDAAYSDGVSELFTDTDMLDLVLLELSRKKSDMSITVTDPYRW